MAKQSVLEFPKPSPTPVRRRARTVRTDRAQRVAAALSAYFRTAAQLAGALGTSRDTLRAWRSGEAPARPRVELLDAAELLLELCEATRRYVAEDYQVGDWIIAPDPRLRGFAPARVIRTHGRPGLEVLLSNLVLVAPPRPTGPIDLPSLEELRAALTAGMGAEEVAQIERQIAAAPPIVMTDAELDAEPDAVTDDEGPLEAGVAPQRRS